jgi:hypothetical protein
MTPETWWFLSRASGIVAWLMLTASVLWGIVLATDLFPKWRRRAWLTDLHRWLAGLTPARGDPRRSRRACRPSGSFSPSRAPLWP